MLSDVVNISEAKVHDRHGIEQLIFPKNTIIVEDRGYFDFDLMLNRIAADNVLVHVYKEDENKIIEIITNQLDWEALTISELYKKRRDIELFFKAIKQNLQIESFVGTSENAVKSQIYIALITFLLLELIRRPGNSTKKNLKNISERKKLRKQLEYI